MKIQLTYDEIFLTINGLVELDAHLTKILDNKDRRSVLKGAEVNSLFNPIAKNLRKLRQVYKDLAEDKDDLFLKFCEKDEETKLVKKFKFDKRDKDGNVDEGYTGKITDETSAAMYDQALKDFEKTPHEVEVHTIPLKKIENLEVSGRIISLLLDRVLMEAAAEGEPA